MAADISAPQFANDEEARQFLEAVRWPNGPVCPHCRSEGAWPIKTKARTLKNGKSSPARAGLYKCAAYKCGEQFSVTVGTVFQRSKIPLTKWLMAAYLLTSSNKGISAHQLHRTLGVTYKTAWFLAHRIREAMKAGSTAAADAEVSKVRKGICALMPGGFPSAPRAARRRRSSDQDAGIRRARNGHPPG